MFLHYSRVKQVITPRMSQILLGEIINLPVTSLKLLWHEQVVNFKDFSRPFQVLFKTITKIQDLLKIYEPCNNNNYYNNNNNNNDKNNNNADKNDNDKKI